MNGVSINFQASLQQDPAATLVMVHGFGATLASWDDIYPELASAASVVRFDLKGSGFSSKPADDAYRLDDHADILLALIKRLELRKVVLVGHSMGGAISLIGYLHNLDAGSAVDIAGLVLIDGAVYPQGFPFFVSALRNPLTRRFSEWLPARTRVRLVLGYSMKVKSRITPKKVASYAFALAAPGAARALARTARHIVPANVDTIIGRISEIRVPTLVIWGQDDRVTPLENGRRLHESIAQSRLIVLPETGHLPQEERPNDVVKAIKDFLETLP